MIKEETGSHGMTIGGFSPYHKGHHEVVQQMKKAGHTSTNVFATQSGRRPIPPKKKVEYIKAAAGESVHVSTAQTPFHAAAKLHAAGKRGKLVVYGGSDRAGIVDRLRKYNGKKGDHGYYKFDSIEFKQVGAERKEGAKGIAGFSGTAARQSKSAEELKQHLPKELHSRAAEIFKDMNESTNPAAIFLVGGPGSGKDFLIHSVFNEHNLIELSLNKLNKAIDEQRNLVEFEEFPSVIINGTAENKDKIYVCKQILEAMGYDTAMVFVYTTDDVSRNRNNFRLMKGSKTFNEEVRKSRYDISLANMNTFVEDFNTFFIYDNSENVIIAEESRKDEIAGWLRELSEGIERFLGERVMEVGTTDSSNFMKHLTPGQVTNDAQTYAEAEANADEDKKKGVRRKEQNPLASSEGDARGGGIAIARSAEPTVSEQKNKKKTLKDVKGLSVAKMGMSSYFDGRMGAVPTGGVGLTTTAVQEEIK